MDLRDLNATYFDRTQHRGEADSWTARSTTGVATSAHYLASGAGAEILRQGGNAVDAAIATSFALGVCEPAGSGLGGMALAVIYLRDTDRVFTVEGPCLAPRNATPESVAAANRYRGHAAVAVPMHVATMSYLYRRYATLPLGTLLAPAIQIAEEGFPVTPTLARLTETYRKALSQHSAGALFLREGQPLRMGELLRQPTIGKTLKRLAEHGLEDFYEGEIGRQIAADMQAGGGFVSAADLQPAPQPTERAPLSGPLGEDLVYAVGPPGGGMALIQLCQLFSASRRDALDLDDPADAVLLAKMIRQVRSDRRRYRLEQQADGPGEAERFLQTDFNRKRLATLLESQPDSDGETSHISIMDHQGNAVAMTQSIERSFGSAVATPQLGFCYNGYLRAFKVENRKHPYYLRPGLPARSNACPTLVMREGRPSVVIGSTGSERMVSSIFCTLMRLRRQDPFTAAHGPRLHCSPEGLVLYEADRFPPETADALKASGFELDAATAYDFRMGGLQLVAVEDDTSTGVADPRRDGAAISG